MSDYRRREVAVLEQLAFGVLSDPKTTPEDRAAARARLEGRGEPDYSRLSAAELAVLEVLTRKATPGAEPRPPSWNAYVAGQYVGHARAFADELAREAETLAHADESTKRST
ncbi:MAG: hypothetical protein JO257_06025 [Deltaproteobacteria bacterium]|nr:hypothetical protein [Deltaproteobacteria bacterium]